MAIAKMKKFTLLTFAEHKERLLKELQRFENVHFMDLQKSGDGEHRLSEDTSPETIDRFEDEFEKIKFAMSKIEPYVEAPKGLKALTTPPVTVGFTEFDSFVDTYDYESVCKEVQSATAEINASRSEITKLKTENENLKAWFALDASVAALEGFKYVKCVIGSVGKQSGDSFISAVSEKFEAAYIEKISEQKDELILLIIVPASEFEEAYAELKSLGFTRASISFKGMPLEVQERNIKRIQELEGIQNEASKRIAAFSGEFDNLKIAYDYYLTAIERENARRNFLKTETAVVIEGWAPADDFDAFKGILASVCGEDYYLEESDVPKDSEDVPIKLKNNKMIWAFEGLTETFSMPKYNDIDPTPLFMPFYLLFFGFMLGDAGYGLILLAATWAALKYCYFNDGMRRFIKFFQYLSYSTIFAGIIYGSAFGKTVFTPLTGPDGAPKAILDSQLDVTTMMILSVAIGVVQMLFGLLVKAYVLARNGDVLAAIFDALFWFVAVSSGLGWLMGIIGVIPPGASSMFMWIFFASLLGLAATQGRANEKLAIKAVAGIYSVYGMTSYIGDLVSYTRIAALALSGAYISFAFNIMSELFPKGPMRIIFGTIVYLIGLVLNLGLSALGAYVHTLRLQYVEFFSKFYEGGGVPFNPFKLKNKFVNIKKEN